MQVFDGGDDAYEGNFEYSSEENLSGGGSYSLGCVHERNIKFMLKFGMNWMSIVTINISLILTHIHTPRDIFMKNESELISSENPSCICVS